MSCYDAAVTASRALENALSSDNATLEASPGAALEPRSPQTSTLVCEGTESTKGSRPTSARASRPTSARGSQPTSAKQTAVKVEVESDRQRANEARLREYKAASTRHAAHVLAERAQQAERRRSTALQEHYALDAAQVCEHPALSRCILTTHRGSRDVH